MMRAFLKPVFVVLVVVSFAVLFAWGLTMTYSYDLINGDFGFRFYEGNNITASPLEGKPAFTVIGDNPGVRSPLLGWPQGIPLKKYQRITIMANVIVRDASGQKIDGGLANGEVYVKDETGRWNTGGWNNPFQFTEPVLLDGEFHTYSVDLSGVRLDLKILRFSIELTDGPVPGTTETWIIYEVRFE